MVSPEKFRLPAVRLASHGSPDGRHASGGWDRGYPACPLTLPSMARLEALQSDRVMKICTNGQVTIAIYGVACLLQVVGKAPQSRILGATDISLYTVNLSNLSKSVAPKFEKNLFAVIPGRAGPWQVRTIIHFHFYLYQEKTHHVTFIMTEVDPSAPISKVEFPQLLRIPICFHYHVKFTLNLYYKKGLECCPIERASERTCRRFFIFRATATP